MFNDAMQAQYIFKAGKPKRDGYLKAMELLGTDKGSTLFVGDQLFTDVWGQGMPGSILCLYSLSIKKKKFRSF